MIRLNAIFHVEGLDPESIQLIRHKDQKYERWSRKSLFDFWYSDRSSFEQYQSIQNKRSAFRIGGLVASFVVTAARENLFVGLYRVLERRAATADDIDPLWGTVLTTEQVIHRLELTSLMSDYVQRLSIETWNDAINYVKRASTANPTVSQIKFSKEDERFPGYRNFVRRLTDVPNIFPSWHQHLSSKGIYLLTFEDGFQYVGSATGQTGFFGRWLDYARDGTGGNKVLINDKRDARTATVTVVEVSGSAEHPRNVVHHEMVWQRKLGTRAKRLGDGDEIPPDA